MQAKMSIEASQNAFVLYKGRKSVRAESDNLRVTATTEGGHIAEITHKKTGVNPLWTPPWPSIEPSAYDPAAHAPVYGDTAESPLLAGLMGHSICLDTYGGPSPEEAAAGMPIHGEGPTAHYDADGAGDSISLSATLPLAQVRFERRIRLVPGGSVVSFSESVSNLSACDRPIAWTQHVTLGPPFLAGGATQFRASVTRSKVIDSEFGGQQKTGAEFAWPMCPKKDGSVSDLRVYPADAASGGFTTHLVDPVRDHGFFLAWSPAAKIAFGYVWKRADFPWMCRWEENHLREGAPWNSRTMTCGMEFGISPTIESRRDMVQRNSLWGVPSYRWLPANTTISASYCAFIIPAESVPESAIWDGHESVQLL
jgi:hypothetical protein